MENTNGILIFGASGLIGGYLYDYLKEADKKVIGTYFKNKRNGMIPYDIVSSTINGLDLKDIKYAIISSAVTKIDNCKNNPEYSHKVNVLGIKKVIKEVSERAIIPVFLSSAAVFDGVKGNYKEEDEKNPISLYGKQKLEVEEFIINNIKKYLIIRPGKVFGVRSREGVLFTDWYEKYKKNEKIFCANDEQLSPTYAGDVARAIFFLIKKDLDGIWHINYPEHFSRYGLALKFFNYLDIKDAKIERCSIDDFNFSEKRMKNSYLNISKFVNETYFKFTELDKIFELIKNNINI